MTKTTKTMTVAAFAKLDKAAKLAWQAALPRHKLSRLFRDMTAEGLKDLTADILRRGQDEPVEILDGEVFDGHHRREACTAAGIVMTWVDVTGTARAKTFAKARDAAMSANLHRRHADDNQKVALGIIRGKVATEIKAAAKRSKAGSKAGGKARQAGKVAGKREKAPTVARILKDALGVTEDWGKIAQASMEACKASKLKVTTDFDKVYATVEKVAEAFFTAKKTAKTRKPAANSTPPAPVELSCDQPLDGPPEGADKPAARIDWEFKCKEAQDEVKRLKIALVDMSEQRDAVIVALQEANESLADQGKDGAAVEGLKPLQLAKVADAATKVPTKRRKAKASKAKGKARVAAESKAKAGRPKAGGAVDLVASLKALAKSANAGSSLRKLIDMEDEDVAEIIGQAKTLNGACRKAKAALAA